MLNIKLLKLIQARLVEEISIATFAQKFDDGVNVGEERGRKAREIEVIKNSLKAGISVDIIAEITGLSLDAIERLLKEGAI